MTDEQLPPDPLRLSFCDTETLSLATDAPVAEVCIINATHDFVANTLTVEEPYTDFVWLTAAQWSRADPNSLRLNHLMARHPQLLERMVFGDESATMKQSHAVAYEVARRTALRHMVGAVINFDTERLIPMLLGRGVPYVWHYHVRDVEAIVAGYLAGMHAATGTSGGLKDLAAGPWKSNVLYEALEQVTGRKIRGPKEDVHTAQGDTLEVVAAYAAVYGAEVTAPMVATQGRAL